MYFFSAVNSPSVMDLKCRARLLTVITDPKEIKKDVIFHNLPVKSESPNRPESVWRGSQVLDHPGFITHRSQLAK